jgi:hypothetical protein
MVSQPEQLSHFVLKSLMPRVEPILYRNISIFHELDARSLVDSLTLRSKEVVNLFVGVSICPETTIRLLRLCPRLAVLDLRVGGNTFCKFNKILHTLNNLTYLRDLSLDPALLFGTCFMYLSDGAIFH